MVSSHPLNAPSLVDALHVAIRERILTGELPGGTPLTEMDIAAQYTVARPTAKSAMERLVHEGLLRRATNKTARVPVLNAEDIRDLYLSRAFLEREVMAALAAKRHVPDTAWESVQALREAASDPTVTKVVRIDIAFHRALVNAIGSRRLNRLYESLMGEVHLCMAQVQANRLLSPDQIAGEHQAILDAIRAGATRRVSEVVTDHLDHACQRLLSHVETAASARPPPPRDSSP